MAGLDLNIDKNTHMNTLQHIPVWVFFVLIGLIAMGLLQTRTRQLRRQRLRGISIALTIFTLVGVVQQWRHTLWLALGLLSWAAIGLSALYGLFSGLLNARALRLLKLRNPTGSAS
jgi:hypothetical protein